MTDIVERLRSPEVFIDVGGMVSPVAHQAADEIERLRKALRYEENRFSRIGTHGDGCWKWGPSHYECALGETQRLRDALTSIAHAPQGKVFCRDGHEEAYLIAKGTLEEGDGN